jgi:hypothetical protein
MWIIGRITNTYKLRVRTLGLFFSIFGSHHVATMAEQLYEGSPDQLWAIAHTELFQETRCCLHWLQQDFWKEPCECYRTTQHPPCLRVYHRVRSITFGDGEF